MDTSTLALFGTAATVGVVHTILGPDHYLPFVAMSRARNWSISKTCVITIACGIGHLVGSVALGLIGIAVGIAVFKLETIEAVRGDIAGWMFIAFGVAYTAWGLRRAIRNRPHSHWHTHADGTTHAHEHVHENEHAHAHSAHSNTGALMAPPPAEKKSLTPWILFTIFVFGPCEPLIPILMYPAAQGSLAGVVGVTLIFGAATIGTMLIAVLVAHRLTARVRMGSLARYGHSLAGATVLACGLAIKFGL